MAGLLYSLGRFSVRRRWLVLLTWVTILLAVVVSAKALGGETSQRFDLPGTESQQALDLLSARFPSQSGSTMRVVAEVPEGRKLSEDEFSALAGVYADVQAFDGVIPAPGFTPGQAPSAEALAAAVTITPDERIAFAEVRFAAAAQEVAPETVTRIRDAFVQAAPPAAQITFGGEVIAAAQRGDPPASEMIGLAVAVVVLLFAFGSVVAMGLPLITALIGVGIGIMGITVTAAFVDISETGPTLATMIGLAVGIDYSLFVVTRHRQFLAEGHDVPEAAARANATAGGAVVFAGMTVVIAIAGLAVVGIPFLTVMGLAAAGTVFIAVLIAVSLTPALLGIAGRRIDKWALPGMKATTGEDPHASSGLGARFARLVTSYPVPFLAAGLGVMSVLAIPLMDMELGLPDDGTEPAATTQRQAYDTLAEGFGPGFNGPLTLVVDLTSAANADATLAALRDAVAADPGVQNVGAPIRNAAGNTAILAVVPRTGPADARTATLVHRLRDDVIPPAVRGSGVDVAVAGNTAMNIDISDKLTDALPMFMAVVIGLTMLLLMVVFRSILVPIKAALAILLSIGASFGVVVAIFQWGWFAGLIGVENSVPIVSFLPLMMFAILFGLSMDYEVFILSRVREEYTHNGGQARAAVLTGLASSARVITAAALIMISVFGAFVLGDDVIIKMFGIGLAVAVLLDATIVRIIIVPAVMALFDRAAWWLPSWLNRSLPNLDVEGEALMRRLLGDEPEPEGAI